MSALSQVQLRRISLRYRVDGPTGLISKRCSRPSNNRLDASLEAQEVKILRESYPDFGPTLAREKLLERHGLLIGREKLRGMVAFYSDKHTIFHVNKRSGVGGNGMTQYGRALHELGIDILCANSAAAKGRVERAHGTLQDRL